MTETTTFELWTANEINRAIHMIDEAWGEGAGWKDAREILCDVTLKCEQRHAENKKANEGAFAAQRDEIERLAMQVEEATSDKVVALTEKLAECNDTLEAYAKDVDKMHGEKAKLSEELARAVRIAEALQERVGVLAGFYDTTRNAMALTAQALQILNKRE